MKFIAALFLAVTAVMAASNDALQCAQVAERCNPNGSPPVECCLADCYIPEGETQGWCRKN
ncbi:hypothetical protein N7457_009310 [Penicillium paradoxum]|uniref:uncharacterized protein n=1 Tax=Penicillium paradoxum TaxID=176176 RepID=UPI0025499D79|nr:uncharacterized protein N7457_009310 [Penicillium paradoxum]KAJ5774414.1 hypothetical protein N7457_009310 [Penicillium paradoxum]